jgi:hypothetical protein
MDHDNTQQDGGAYRRRQVLAGATVLGTVGVAGCVSLSSDDPEVGLIGSGRRADRSPEGHRSPSYRR